MNEIPAEKVAEREKIKTKIDKFIAAGKKITSIAKGVVKDQIITKIGVSKKDRKRIDEAKKTGKIRL